MVLQVSNKTTSLNHIKGKRRSFRSRFVKREDRMKLVVIISINRKTALAVLPYRLKVRRPKFSSVLYFVGRNFRHLAKISSLSADGYFQQTNFFTNFSFFVHAFFIHNDLSWPKYTKKCLNRHG